MNPLRAAIRFHRLRASWLGDGGHPVSLELATHRSQVCKTCPLNAQMPLWELFTAPAARHLRSQIELKASMQLAVPGEDGLHICSACLCVLTLKVWVPIARVLETTPLEGLADGCWIRAEAAALDKTP